MIPYLLLGVGLLTGMYTVVHLIYRYRKPRDYAWLVKHDLGARIDAEAYGQDSEPR